MYNPLASETCFASSKTIGYYNVTGSNGVGLCADALLGLKVNIFSLLITLALFFVELCELLDGAFVDHLQGLSAAILPVSTLGGLVYIGNYNLLNCAHNGLKQR